MRNIRLDQRIVLAVAAAVLPFAAFIAVGAEPTNTRQPAMKAKAAKTLAGSKRLVSQASENASAPVIKGQAPSHKTNHAADPLAVAAEVDRVIAADLQKSDVTIAPRCSDEDFLR